MEVLKEPAVGQSSPDVCYWRGRARAAAGRHTEAIDDYTRAIEQDPDDAAPHLFRGVAYARLGHDRKAEADFQQALQSADSLERRLAVHRYRAVARSGRGDSEGASEDIERLIALDPGPASLADRALLRLRQDDLEGAEADLREAVKLDPADPLAWSWLGVVLGQQGAHAEALSCHTMAAQADPQEPDVHYHLARTLMLSERYKEAVRALDRAIELYPYSSRYFANRAVAKDKLGMSREAIADYTRAFDINPRDTVSLYNRAAELLRQGRYEEAIRDYTRFIELRPKDPAGFAWRAVAHARQGNRRKALEDDRWARKLRLEGNPSLPDEQPWSRRVPQRNLGDF